MNNLAAAGMEEGPITEPSFDIESYLTTRDHLEPFLMAEIGHDSVPVAYTQPTPFNGNRAYVGFEAWLRDPNGAKRELIRTEHEAQHGDEQNIYFHQLALGGIIRQANDDYGTEKWYEGPYNPDTDLVDGSVQEVLIGNVFGDRYVGYSEERATALLEEASRIVAPNGVIIIRETITPFVARNMLKEMAQMQGLVATRVDLESPHWEQLERRFGRSPRFDRQLFPAGSYYLFLTKPPVQEAA